MNPRTLSLPPALEEAIVKELSFLGVSLQDHKSIARSVLRLSTYYIENQLAQTPWQEDWCHVAYLAYYLPLNFLRAQAVFHEAAVRGFFTDVSWSQVFDFGSGLGSATLPFILSESFLGSDAKKFTHVEISPSAQKRHQSLLSSLENQLAQRPSSFDRVLGKSSVWKNLSEFSSAEAQRQLGIFSYSLTEFPEWPRWLFDFDSLLLIEPSTRDDGRRLLEFREKALEKGFYAWAPCTHQAPCPLLHQSPRDWCHDRIHFAAPGWFADIENQLPMKNQTLTMSYLVLSRRPCPAPDFKSQWRVVGDLLEDKGKRRQLICRSSEREFLVWMDRHWKKKDVGFSRGELITAMTDVEKIQQELRVPAPE